MSRTLDVKLFTRISFHLDQCLLNIPSSTFAQTLLAYLVLHRQTSHTRAELAALLWPNTLQPESLANLRRLLYQVRKVLPELDQLVEVKRSTLQWCFSGTLKLDIEAFNHAIQAAKIAKADSSAARQILEETTQLYGDFLPYCEDAWAISTREKLQQTYIQILTSLTQLLETDQEYDTAAQYAQKILTIAPLREATYCTLMRLHAQQDNLSAVLQIYQQCEAILQKELGLDPSAATQQLVNDLQQQASATPTDSAPQKSCTDLESIDTNPRSSWENAPDVSLFYGRTEELKILKHWVAQEHCRLLAILGMGGIGKTALAVKLGQALEGAQNADDASEQSTDKIFQAVVWRSLRNAPPLETLMAELVPLLSNQQDTEATPSRLLHWLRQSACLVILDNSETILKGGERAGQFRAGYDNYAELFRLIAETPHQSCLILTSREKSAQIAIAEGVGAAVRSLSLRGSQEAAQAILKAKGLMGTPEEHQHLCQLYSYNPLALKLVASSIQDLFDGEIKIFLEQDTVFFNGVRYLLDQQFDRLSKLEQTAMYWLAINRSWTEIGELAEDIMPPVAKTKLIEALRSLMWRSLIERQAQTYTQQPVIMEYVTNRLIEQVNHELTNSFTKAVSDSTNLLLPTDLVNVYALLKTTVKDYVRDSQRRLILVPIADHLLSSFNQVETVAGRIKVIVRSLRQNSSLATGYICGNLLNLCWHLRIELTGFSFSELTIRQAYLDDMMLQNVNFKGADLCKTTFSQALGSVLSVAFSPDSQLLATGDSEGFIHLWQVIDGQLRLSLQAHDTWAWCIAWSPDGQMIASGSADQTIKIWNIQTGQCLNTLKGHSSMVISLAWSPDGKVIASGGHGSIVKLWDTQTGFCINTLSVQTFWMIRGLTWAPDSKEIVIGSQGLIEFWDVVTGQLTKTLAGHQDYVCSVSWSPTGDRLASSSLDCTAKIWNVHTGKCLSTLRHNDSVLSVAWSPDGQFLLSGSQDTTAKLWDVSTDRCLKILQGHRQWIMSIDWSRDGQVLASGSMDQTARLWDAKAGQPIRVLRGHVDAIWSVDWYPDGQTFCSGSINHSIRMWDVHTGKNIRTLQGDMSALWCEDLSPDSKTLASCGASLVINLWNIEMQQVTQTLRGHSDAVRCVAFSPDGQTLASGSYDHTIKIWDLQTGHCLKTLTGHTHWVSCIAWNPVGTYLVSSGFDQTIKLWNITLGQCVRTLEGHNKPTISGVDWSRDGRWIASGSHDRTVRFWNAKTGECLDVFQGHLSDIYTVTWSPDSTIVASGSSDQTIRLWDIRTRKSKVLVGHGNWIFSLAFSPDSRKLLSGSADKTVRLWDISTGGCLKTFRSDRPYEGMNITGITGITEAQRLTLQALGAVSDFS